MALIIIISTLLIIFVIMLSYFVYSNSINKKLNRTKKRVIYNYEPVKKKFSKVCHVFAYVCFAFIGIGGAGLFITTYSVVKEISKFNYIYGIEDYEYPELDVELFPTKKSSVQNLSSVSKAIEEDDYSFYLTKNNIYKCDKDSDLVIKYVCDNPKGNGKLYSYKTWLLMVVSNDYVSNIYVYEKESMDILKSISVDGKIIHADINNQNLNLIVINSGVRNPFKIGLKFEGEKKTGFIKRLVCLNDSICRYIISHFQYNLETDVTVQSAFGVADYYFLQNNAYYFAFNYYNNDRLTSSSYILKYNPDSMIITDWIKLEGNVYNDLKVVGETIYCITTEDEGVFTSYALDEKLKVVNSKKTQLSSNDICDVSVNSMLIYHNESDIYKDSLKIVADKLFYCDEKLISVMKINNTLKLIVSDKKVENEYSINLTDNITNYEISDCYEKDMKLYVVYKKAGFLGLLCINLKTKKVCNFDPIYEDIIVGYNDVFVIEDEEKQSFLLID